MKHYPFIIFILCILLIIPALNSCEKKTEVMGDIELPPAPLVSESESWAVIEAAYLRLRERPESNAKLVTTLWKGYVLEVKSRSPGKSIVDDAEDYWYQVNYDGLKGWVFGSYLVICDSHEAAEIEARAIRAAE